MHRLEHRDRRKYPCPAYLDKDIQQFCGCLPRLELESDGVPRALVRSTQDLLVLVGIHLYDHPEGHHEMVDRAYDWITQYTWDNVCTKWNAVFEEACEANELEQKLTKEANDRANTPNRKQRRAGKHK